MIPAPTAQPVPASVALPDRVSFPDGLVGLPALRSFSVVVDDAGLVELLSADDADFGLLAIDGETVRAGITTELAGHGFIAADEAVLVVLSLHGEPASLTANLAGPIAVGGDGRARQLVVGLPGFDVRSPVPVAG